LVTVPPLDAPPFADPPLLLEVPPLLLDAPPFKEPPLDAPPFEKPPEFVAPPRVTSELAPPELVFAPPWLVAPAVAAPPLALPPLGPAPLPPLPPSVDEAVLQASIQVVASTASAFRAGNPREDERPEVRQRIMVRPFLKNPLDSITRQRHAAAEMRFLAENTLGRIFR
jgi:hypothetical protein